MSWAEKHIFNPKESMTEIDTLMIAFDFNHYNLVGHVVEKKSFNLTL